jgi:hypothetical protein
MTPEGRILAAVKRQSKALGLRMIRMAFLPGVEGGWPDVLILGPNRGALFIETKAPGQPLRRLQEHRAKEITAMGHQFCKVDNVRQVYDVLAAFAEGCADV